MLLTLQLTRYYSWKYSKSFLTKYSTLSQNWSESRHKSLACNGWCGMWMQHNVSGLCARHTVNPLHPWNAQFFMRRFREILGQCTRAIAIESMFLFMASPRTCWHLQAIHSYTVWICIMYKYVLYNICVRAQTYLHTVSNIFLF